MDKILNAVIDMAENSLSLYSKITIGAMPPNGGLSMFVGASSPQNTFLNKGTHNTIYATLNGKHKKQQKVIEALESIHAFLSKRKSYPSGDDWQITDIATEAFPAYIGQESGEQWLYGSILKITFYLGGINE
jgi:hypothetical protein